MYMSKGKQISLALGLDSVGEKFSLDVDISEFLIPNSEKFSENSQSSLNNLELYKDS